MMGRHSRSAAVVGVLMVLATSLLVGCGGSGSSTATRVKMAPDFSGITLDGSEVSLGQYRGKPLVLAFMASW